MLQFIRAKKNLCDENEFHIFRRKKNRLRCDLRAERVLKYFTLNMVQFIEYLITATELRLFERTTR